MMGRDHTIFAVEDGMVKFDRSSVRARIMVVKEEAADAAPAKETARTRKFAKCVAALLAQSAAFRARALHGRAAAARVFACGSRVCASAGSRRATLPPRRRPPSLAEHTRGLCVLISTICDYLPRVRMRFLHCLCWGRSRLLLTLFSRLGHAYNACSPGLSPPVRLSGFLRPAYAFCAGQSRHCSAPSWCDGDPPRAASRGIARV